MKTQFHNSFKKRYKKLPPNIRNQFDKRLRLFEENPLYPLLHNHQLVGKRNSQWSINVTGDWRAIYTWKGEHTAVFLDIDTHSNLYG